MSIGAVPNRTTFSAFAFAIAIALCFFIDYESLSRGSTNELAISALIPLSLGTGVSIQWGLGRFTHAIVPFFLFSVLFFWLSVFLLASYSTYVPSAHTFEICYFGFTLPIVFYFVFDRMLGKAPLRVRFLATRALDYCENSRFTDSFWKIALTMSFIFSTLFFIQAGGIPMLAENPELARVTAMQSAGTIHRLSYLCLHFGAIALAVSVASHHRHGRATGTRALRRHAWRVAPLVALCFYNMLTGPRSPALWAIIYFTVSLHLLTNREVSLRRLVIPAAAVLLIVAIAGGIRYSGVRNVNYDDTAIRFVNRLYMNVVNADRIVEAFEHERISPNSLWIDLAVLAPGHQEDLGTVLKEHVGASYDGGGITVPLPAEGFMNYGEAGVLVYALLAALLMKFADRVSGIARSPLYGFIFSIILPMQFLGFVSMGIGGVVVKTFIPTVVTAVFLALSTWVVVGSFGHRR